MVSNTRNYWVFGPCPWSDIVKNTFQKQIQFRKCVFYNTGQLTKSRNTVIPSGFKIFPFQIS
jgi:hypothetical protein